MDQRIDAAMSLESKIDTSKDEVRQVMDVMLRTKTELNQQVSDMRNDLHKQQLSNHELEKRMEKQIADCSYWMQRYTAAFNDND